MDGFGGQDIDLSATSQSICGLTRCFYNFTTGEANMFYSPTSGIGLQILRTSNEGCPTTGACAINTTTVPNLTSLQNVVDAGGQIYLSTYPPANLKYSGNFTTNVTGADGGCVDTSNFTAWANYIVSLIQFYQANSVPISWVAAWNEPILGGNACFFPASLQDTFIKTYLGPAITAAGLTTQIAISDDNVSNNLSSGTCLADAACASYISVMGFHGYGTGTQDGMGHGYCCRTAIPRPANTSGLHVWQSEVNGGFTYNSTATLWNWDASIADGLVWARSIHDYLTITNASAWEFWELADCCSTEIGAPFNDGLAQNNLTTFSKRYYVIGNWSKFMRRGWVRIDATANPTSGVYVTAFKDPSSDNFAIVAINQNSSAVTVDFSLSGFPSVASVTPTVTSASDNLTDQTEVAVTGAAFSNSLPATSVVTFHATSSSSSSKIPAPPTNLSSTIK
jgi:glucuronoarabinoxylan endo-1,4-beta-xylanase